jgi:hypothetical protein
MPDSNNAFVTIRNSTATLYRRKPVSGNTGWLQDHRPPTLAGVTSFYGFVNNGTKDTRDTDILE